MQRSIATIALTVWSAAVISAGGLQTSRVSSTQEIDREIWSILSATVASDDIAGMGRVYFPDAVLVSPKETRSIKETLDYYPFEMLLAKSGGEWRVLMERQFAEVNQEAWDKLVK